MKTPIKMFLVKFGDFENFRLLTSIPPSMIFGQKVEKNFFSQKRSEMIEITYLYHKNMILSDFREKIDRARFFTILPCKKGGKLPPSKKSIFSWENHFLTRFFFTIRFLIPYFTILSSFWGGFPIKNSSSRYPWRSLHISRTFYYHWW